MNAEEDKDPMNKALRTLISIYRRRALAKKKAAPPPPAPVKKEDNAVLEAALQEE